MAKGSEKELRDETHGIITSIANIKPGHADKIKAVLKALREQEDSPGKKVGTIHFVRWVLIDDDTRLLFTSNFDGRWDDYIDVFINRAHEGLDAVWSNCEGFPAGGSQDRENFKKYIEQTEYKAEYFWCAYPDLTVQQILPISGQA
jgi:hypothetical protein